MCVCVVCAVLYDVVCVGVLLCPCLFKVAHFERDLLCDVVWLVFVIVCVSLIRK